MPHNNKMYRVSFTCPEWGSVPVETDEAAESPEQAWEEVQANFSCEHAREAHTLVSAVEIDQDAEYLAHGNDGELYIQVRFDAGMECDQCHARAAYKHLESDCYLCAECFDQLDGE